MGREDCSQQLWKTMLNSGDLWLNETRVWRSSPCPIKTYLLAEGVLLPHPLVAKISFTLGSCVYYKTTIQNSKPRWNINASGLILSMRAWSTEAHITRWNEFTRSRMVESITRLLLIASVSMLAYLMLPIKLFWHTMESTTKRGRMANKSIFLVIHQALRNVWWLTPTWSRMNN